MEMNAGIEIFKKSGISEINFMDGSPPCSPEVGLARFNDAKRNFSSSQEDLDFVEGLYAELDCLFAMRDDRKFFKFLLYEIHIGTQIESLMAKLGI